MKIGVTIHATDRAMNPVEVAREAEARGFYSFYIPEHTHIPTSRRTPAPTGTPELGEEYLRSPVDSITVHWGEPEEGTDGIEVFSPWELLPGPCAAAGDGVVAA